MTDFISQRLLSSMNDCCYTYEVIYISVQCNTVRKCFPSMVSLYFCVENVSFQLIIKRNDCKCVASGSQLSTKTALC